MSYIDENTDVCDIGKFINKVSGIESDSASPTDIWFINFNKNTFYKNKNNKIVNGFLKIFIEYTSLPPLNSSDKISKIRHQDNINTLKGLNYELDVYKDVIRPLIDYNICPNFIKYLASGKKCSYDNLLNILKDNLYSNGKKISLDRIKELLNRNINSILKFSSFRKAIDNVFIDFNDLVDDVPNLKYNMILNEQIPPNSLKFKDFYEKHLSTKAGIKILTSVLFQIFTACYAMSLSKTVHNDLHPGNIFIEELKNPEVVEYCINNKKYKIKIKYKAYIYDFDRSYSERFGDNYMLSDLCDITSQCNIYIENKDILKIVCYLVFKFRKKKKQNLLLDIINLLVPYDDKDKAEYNIKLLLNEYQDGCFFESLGEDGQIDFFKKFNSSEKIVEKIANNLELTKEKVKQKNIFVLNKDFFNYNGTINLDKYKKIYKETINKDEDDNYEKEDEKEDEKKYEPKTKEPKPCNSYQIRNPATGRCVLKRSPLGKKILKEMGASAGISKKESSGRRKSIPKSIPRKKECNPDQIRNPATGRCVLKRSPLGKKILKEMGGGSGSKKKSVPKTVPRKKECNADQIRNPATGRCVLKRSPLGKKIMKERNGM